MFLNEILKKGGKVMAMITIANLMLVASALTVLVKLYLALVQFVKNSSIGKKIKPSPLFAKKEKQ